MFTIIVFIVAVAAAVRGFKLGLARQTPALIGIAFGSICARLLGPAIVPALAEAIPGLAGQVEEQYVLDVLSGSIIFCAVYFVFRVITAFLGRVLSNPDRTILDNIGGALLTVFAWLLWLSIGFNVLLALRPHGELLAAMQSDDGNAVEEVMLLSPALFGGEDAEDLAHRIQLHEAKRIS